MPFLHILSRVHNVNVIHPCGYWPYPCFCNVWLLSFLGLLYCVLWEEVIMHSPHLRNQGFALLPWEYSISINYLDFFLYGRFFSFLPFFFHLFCYLYQCVFMDIHIILWVIIQYFFILLLKLTQFWSSAGLSVGSSAPLKCVFLYYVFFFLSFFGEHVFFCVSLEDAPSSKAASVRFGLYLLSSFMLGLAMQLLKPGQAPHNTEKNPLGGTHVVSRNASE